MATLKKDKKPCRVCGKLSAVLTYTDKLRHTHKCPHGAICRGSVTWAEKCKLCAEATPSPATSSSDMKMEKACARKWLEVNSAGLDSERQFETAVDALALHIFHYIVGWDDEVPTLREQENFRVEAEHRGAEVVYAPSPATKETRSELFTVEREDGEWVASNEADYSCYLSRSEAEEALSGDADNREVSEALYKIIRFTRSAPSPAREETPPLAAHLSRTYNFSTQADTFEAMKMGQDLFDAGARSAVVAPIGFQQTCSECDGDGCGKCDPIGTALKIAQRKIWLAADETRDAEEVSLAVIADLLAGVAVLPSTPSPVDIWVPSSPTIIGEFCPHGIARWSPIPRSGSPKGKSG